MGTHNISSELEITVGSPQISVFRISDVTHEQNVFENEIVVKGNILCN